MLTLDQFESLGRPQFPDLLDATMIRDYRNCPAFFLYAHLLRRVPSGESIHLVAGGAFAEGLEHFRNHFYAPGTGPLRQSMDRDHFESAFAAGALALIRKYGDFDAEGHAKSLEGVLSAYDYYLRTAWPPHFDTIEPLQAPTGPAVEFTGAVPLNVRHPETGLPLLYGGRYDMIAQYTDNTPGLLGVDEKTTTSLGPQWTKQWELRSQFFGYTHIAREHGIPVSAFLVRGVSILKTKHDHAQVILQPTTYQMERWWLQTQHTVARMVNDWKWGTFDQMFDDACNHYGSCQYKPLCRAKDPLDWMDDYSERHWNPLAKNPTDPQETPEYAA